MLLIINFVWTALLDGLVLNGAENDGMNDSFRCMLNIGTSCVVTSTYMKSARSLFVIEMKKKYTIYIMYS